jgi:meckelin
MTASGECACDAGYRTAGVVGVFPWAAVSCLPAASAAAVLNAYPESAAIAVSYYSVQLASARSATSSLLGKASKAFQHLYASAAVGCLNRKPGTRDDACQALANLCVLQLYSPTATVCALYTAVYNARKAAVNGFQGWPGGGLPFLTYSPSEARAVASDPALTRPMSFDEAKEAGTSDTLQLFVARYSLNGTFLGITRLRNQLEGFCAAAAAAAVPTATSGATEWSSSSVTTPWLGFGYGYSSVFACDLNLLAASPLATDPVFYDLYVRDLAADAAQVAATARAAAGGSSAASSSASAGSAAGLPLTLYPVPVAITNYVAADGSTPNVNKASASEADDVYARRFTLVEAVSGITAAGAASEVLRYASSLRLTVRALRDGNNRPTLLSPPVLTITYRERLTSEVAAAASDASPNSMAVDATAFAVEYTSENADFGRTVLALAVSLGMLVLGWTFVRVAGWIRMNARTPFEAAIGLVHVAKLGEHLLTSFAPAYFWFLWAICLYWLVFFKLQTAVYILLPVDRPGYVDNEYVPFTAALTTVFICYLLRVLLAIYYQGTCLLNRTASAPRGAWPMQPFCIISGWRVAVSCRSPVDLPTASLRIIARICYRLSPLAPPRLAVRVDLFFVDWEKPRGALVRTGGDHEAALGKQVAPGMPGGEEARAGDRCRRRRLGASLLGGGNRERMLANSRSPLVLLPPLQPPRPRTLVSLPSQYGARCTQPMSGQSCRHSVGCACPLCWRSSWPSWSLAASSTWPWGDPAPAICRRGPSTPCCSLRTTCSGGWWWRQCSWGGQSSWASGTWTRTPPPPSSTCAPWPR